MSAPRARDQVWSRLGAPSPQSSLSKVEGTTLFHRRQGMRGGGGSGGRKRPGGGGPFGALGRFDGWTVVVPHVVAGWFGGGDAGVLPILDGWFGGGGWRWR